MKRVSQIELLEREIPSPERDLAIDRCYRTYGLGLRSELDLRLPISRGDRCDVHVRYACLDAELAELRRKGLEYLIDADEARFFWSEIGGFVARGGAEILVDPVDAAEADDLRLGVVGPAMAMILRQRGHLLLHGSAVDCNGTAVVFLGRSGAGKSTMAAALHARGHALLSDDVIAVSWRGDGPVLAPGAPQFRLTDEAAAAFDADPERGVAVAPGIGKRCYEAASSISAPVPLGRIYLLEIGAEPRMDPLCARESFLAISSNSLAIRWFLAETNAAQFTDRGRLAAAVPVRRLVRPRDLALLSTVAALVEHDVG